MVELGLPFLKHILEMSMDDRMATVAPLTWKDCSPRLDQVITKVLDLRWYSDQITQGINVSQKYGLRDLGYVFWDKKRLDEVLGLVREDVRALSKRRTRDEDASVEERLQGVKTREGPLSRIAIGFGVASVQDLLESIEY